jgi:hypothetical protein
MNKYQVSGYDDLERGFNRHIEIHKHDGEYFAIFHYEQFLLKTGPQPNEQAALAILITNLQENGYTQLRSRIHFRGKNYLGNQEIWEDHPDPEQPNWWKRWKEAFFLFWDKDRY